MSDGSVISFTERTRENVTFVSFHSGFHYVKDLERKKELERSHHDDAASTSSCQHVFFAEYDVIFSLYFITFLLAREAQLADRI